MRRHLLGILLAGLSFAQSSDPEIAASVDAAKTLADRNTADSLKGALAEYDRLLPLAQRAADRPAESHILYFSGVACLRLGRFPDAVARIEKAIPILRELDDQPVLIDALNDLGLSRTRMSRQQLALESLNESLNLALKLGDDRRQAAALNNLAIVYNDLAEPARARDQLEQALAIFRKVKDGRAQGAALSNIGALYFLEGSPQKALDYYREALTLRQAAGDQRGVASTVSKLGLVYSVLAMHEQAIKYYQEALALGRKTGDQHEEADTLSHLGEAYRNLRDYPRSLDYFTQALALQRKLEKRGAEANDLSNISLVRLDQHDYPKALELIQQAIEIHRAIGAARSVASSQIRLAAILGAQGKSSESLMPLNEALATARNLGDKRLEVGALYQLGRVNADQGDWQTARQQAESALAIAEDVRGSLANYDLRSGYVATARRLYELQIDALMHLHLDEKALAAAERSRARSLLDMLAESRSGILEGVDPELRKSAGAADAKLSALADRLLRIPESNRADRAAANARLQDAALEAGRLRAEIRRTSPRYAALTQPEPVLAADIRRLLDPSTILLEYSLGESRSYLWLVTPGAIESFTLPPREQLEAAARSLHQAWSSNRPGDAAGLSKMLLGPVAARLHAKRIVVAAEGALLYIPFGALPHPSNPARFVADTYELVNVPSASSLALLRRDATGRPPAPKSVAVFADPVFSADDIRVVAGSGARTVPVALGLEGSGLSTLSRIAATRREADQILAYASPGNFLKAVDFEASRELALSPELANFRIIHFATHGLLNNEHPDLSGLVLSMVDPSGSPRNGFLQAHDVYNLKLRADLVVLSACQTALGREVAGEGLVGLTRGFMYAGASRVVASLWKVPDRATSELMRHFYRGMMVRRLSASAALSEASAAMRKDPRWAAPYYWAAFTLQGEWK